LPSDNVLWKYQALSDGLFEKLHVCGILEMFPVVCCRGLEWLALLENGGAKPF
jgi:hypothetical protein